jgi:hypothetical protein
MDGAYTTQNPAIFNDIGYAFRNELTQVLDSLDFLDGTKESFMAYESSNADFPMTPDTVKAAIDFLISVDRMFDCGNTTETDNLNNLDTEYLAQTLLLEFRYPTRYRSWCDNLKYAEDMEYRGTTYNVGRTGAPCTSNAMCEDSYVCLGYYCAPSTSIAKTICPAEQATIHPLYYGLKPSNPEQYACAFTEVYSNEGLGEVDFGVNGPSNPDYRAFGFPGYTNWIEYDNYFGNKCSEGFDWMDVKATHFKDRGNFQQCGNYFTSELMGVATGLQQGERGRDLVHCNSEAFNAIYSETFRRPGEYDRIVPRKVAVANRDQDYFRYNSLETPEKVLPASS